MATGCYIKFQFYPILPEVDTPDPDPLAERTAPVAYVVTFNGRAGDAVPAAGDYTSTLITNLSSITGASVTAALNTINTTVYGVKSANSVFAGPTSGGAAAPAFRALVAADLGTTLEPTFAVVKTPVVRATTSAGLQLQASNEAVCVTFGAGGGCQAVFGDGASFAGLVNVTNASGVQTQAAATQDAIRIIGRAGGTGTHVLTLTPAALDASYTATFPAANIVVSGSAAALTDGRLPRVTTGGLLQDTDIAIGAADGVITRAAGLQLPANIGIGTAVSTGSNIYLSITNADQAENRYGYRSALAVTASAGHAFTNIGFYSVVTCNPASGQALTASTTNPQSMFRGAMYHVGAGTVASMVGFEAYVGNSTGGSGTTTDAAGVRIYARRTAGAITTWKAFEALESGTASTMTNYWFLYDNLGTGAKSYLKNPLLIGTTALVGTETFRNNGATVLGDISIGAADGVISRTAGLQLPANVGIGTAVDTNYGLNLLANVTDPAASNSSFNVSKTVTTTINTSIAAFGTNGSLQFAPAAATTNSSGSTNNALYTGTAYLVGEGVLSNLSGMYLTVGTQTGVGASSVITAANGLVLRLRRTGVSGSTITTYKALNLIETGTTSTVTNYWGLYEDLGTGAKNYLAHALLIGTTALVGSEIARFAGGTAATPTATDVTIGGGSVRAGAAVYGASANFGGATHYSAFETDGTLVFNGDATVWEDINIDLSPLQTGGTSPGFVTIASTNIRLRSFAVNEDVDGSFEIPHSYKLGSNITAHVHFLCDTAPTGTDQVKWQLEYYIVNAGGTVSTSTTIDTGDVAVDTQWKRVDANFTTVITNASLGGQVAFKLKRITATGDAYAGECAVQTFGFHYEQDTVGSRQITTK